MEGGGGSHSDQINEHEFHSFVAETESSGSEYDDEDSSEDEGMQTLSEEEEQREEQSQAGSGFAYPENKPRR